MRALSIGSEHTNIAEPTDWNVDIYRYNGEMLCVFVYNFGMQSSITVSGNVFQFANKKCKIFRVAKSATRLPYIQNYQLKCKQRNIIDLCVAQSFLSAECFVFLALSICTSINCFFFLSDSMYTATKYMLINVPFSIHILQLFDSVDCQLLSVCTYCANCLWISNIYPVDLKRWYRFQSSEAMHFI